MAANPPRMILLPGTDILCRAYAAGTAIATVRKAVASATTRLFTIDSATGIPEASSKIL